MRTRLIWQIFPTFLLVLVVAFLGTSLFLTRSVRLFYLDQKEEQIRSQATMALEIFKTDLLYSQLDAIDNDSKALGQKTGTRYSIILPDGTVVADSDYQIEVMDNHSQRPEIAQALAGSPSLTQRYSHTLQQNLFYYALPVETSVGVIAVIRLAVPLTAIEEQLGQLQAKLMYGFLVGLVLAAIVSIWSSRRISRPLEVMQQGAQQFAAGNFDRKLPLDGTQEASDLALSLNKMAHQLDKRLKTVIEQRNAQDAVLSSMVEGVLAVDNEEKVLQINRAAMRLLGIEGKTIEGKGLHEVIRKTDVQAFVEKALASNEPVQGDIILQTVHGEKFLQANGTLLRDAEENQIGALVVFNDVTHLRRLERVRRDFVANVSHELKTPITAIKGFIETLLDDAHTQQSEQSINFLNIVVKQADRLNAIIEDLLDLSRIEQNSEQASIELEFEPIEPVVKAASQAWMHNARQRGIKVQLQVPESLQAPINPPLLEQALINLVDNAIKYSEEGTKVVVEGVVVDDEVQLRVKDEGCGIPADHLPRLFERFYRVDKARSRKLGGTGLGLAIVKHIAQAHQGRVSVESQIGQGTTFTLHLPIIR